MIRNKYYMLSEDTIIELAMKLVKAESEEDVEKILKEYGLWDSVHWKYFGGIENNYSIIGNQQSDCIAALIEKLINAADAIIEKECLKRGILPIDLEKSPENIQEAIKEYFNVPEGDIRKLEKKELSKMASENILLVSTSKNNKLKGYNPCLSIIDAGCGEYPDTMESTFLSLGKSNKINKRCVQGKFNMGGTGILIFCGNRKFQLILTKRHIDIKTENNEFKDYWGITIVRKQEPKPGQRSSSYTYLAPGGKILRFKSDELFIKPNIDNSQECIPYAKPMSCGTFIKLYNYDMKSYSHKKITMTDGLTDGLNMMIAKAAVPIRLVECRKTRGRTNQSTVAGYEVRLASTGKVQGNIEENFPIKSTMKVDGQELNITIYAFKKDKAENYKKSNSSIVFTLNGQTQGFLSDSMFAKKSVGLEYIKKSIFVIVECSNMKTSYIEDLFMNSRDRLRDSSFAEKVKSELEGVIGSNFALKELRDKRRRENLESSVENNKLLVDNLKSILKTNPGLKDLFSTGLDILHVPIKGLDKNPVKDDDDNDDRSEFIGKEYPTFFELISIKKNGVLERGISTKIKIKIKTDVKNGFFDDELNKSILEIRNNGELVDSFTFNLDRGIIDISIPVKDSTKINDLEKYSYKVVTYRKQSFEEEFTVLFKEKVNRGKKSEKTILEKRLVLPNVIFINEEQLKSNDMKIDSALKIIRGNKDDFIINLDNCHVKNYVDKEKDPIKKEKMLNQYKWSLVLYGISMLSNFLKDNQDREEEYFDKIVESSSKAFAQMLFPIKHLNDKLDICG